MDLLLCTASLDPTAGGPAQSVPQLAAALAGLGHRVGLWSPVAPSPAAQTIDYKTIRLQDPVAQTIDHKTRLQDPVAQTIDHKTIRLQDHVSPPPSPIVPSSHGPIVSPSPGPIVLLTGPFPAALAAFGRPDLVHDNGLWLPCHHQVAQACIRADIPRGVSPRGMLDAWCLRQRRWKKRLAWLLYQRRDLRAAQLLHATSAAERDQFRRLGLHQPVVISPNGVTWPDQPSPEPVERARPEPVEGTKSELRTALFVSRLHPQKGLDLLIAAWAKVRPPGWRMRVVGPGEDSYRQKIIAAVARAGLTDLWTFEDLATGPRKWNLLAEAELFILPSFSESFGIVVAEALGSGLPVITTTATPWAGVYEHRCGWWVDPSVAGITAALREATALPPEQLAQMGQRGATWARAEFHWPAIARTMATAYQAASSNLEDRNQKQKF